MDKQEFIERAVISALPALISDIEAKQTAAVDFSGAMNMRREMQRTVAARAIGYATTLWWALGHEDNEEKEKTLITGETKDEAIERYRAMMKANEGKSFKERRDAINSFRAGR